jgi:hypothetical protein
MRQSSRLISGLLSACLLADPSAVAAFTQPGAPSAPGFSNAAALCRSQAVLAPLQAMLHAYSERKSARLRREAVAARDVRGAEHSALLRIASSLDFYLRRNSSRLIRLKLDVPQVAELLSRVLGRPLISELLLDRDEAERLMNILRSGPPFHGVESLTFRHHLLRAHVRPAAFGRRGEPISMAAWRQSAGNYRAERDRAGQHKLSQPGLDPQQRQDLGKQLYPQAIRMSPGQLKAVADLTEVWRQNSRNDPAVTLLLARTPPLFHAILKLIPHLLKQPMLRVPVNGVMHRVEIMMVPAGIPFAVEEAGDRVEVNAFAWAHKVDGKPVLSLFVHSFPAQGKPLSVDFSAVYHEIVENVILPSLPGIPRKQRHFIALLSETLAGGTVYDLGHDNYVPLPSRFPIEIAAYPDPEKFLSRSREELLDASKRFDLQPGEIADATAKFRSLNLDVAMALAQMMRSRQGAASQTAIAAPAERPKELPAVAESATDDPALGPRLAKNLTLGRLDEFNGPFITVHDPKNLKSDIEKVPTRFARQLVEDDLAIGARYQDGTTLVWTGERRRMPLVLGEIDSGAMGYHPRIIVTGSRFWITSRTLRFGVTPSAGNIEIALFGAAPGEMQIQPSEAIRPNFKFKVGRQGCDYGDKTWDLAPIQFALTARLVPQQPGVYSFEIDHRVPGEELVIEWLRSPAPLSGPGQTIRAILPWIGPLFLAWQSLHPVAASTPDWTAASLSMPWGASAWLAARAILFGRYLVASRRQSIPSDIPPPSSWRIRASA